MLAKVAERGQVTIPKTFRDKLGIHPGTTLDFEIQNGKLVVKKAIISDPIEKVMGCLNMPQTTDEFIKEIRGSVE